MEFNDYRKEAIRYWERRRIIWNIILVPPAIFAYMFAAGIAVGVGDLGQFSYPTVAMLFCFAALGANICYSFVYVLEFWVAGRGSENSYCSKRGFLFVLGCVIGVGLALVGGRNIAILQYPA